VIVDIGRMIFHNGVIVKLAISGKNKIFTNPSSGGIDVSMWKYIYLLSFMVKQGQSASNWHQTAMKYGTEALV
jgi:hypothetical protein